MKLIYKFLFILFVLFSSMAKASNVSYLNGVWMCSLTSTLNDKIGILVTGEYEIDVENKKAWSRSTIKSFTINDPEFNSSLYVEGEDQFILENDVISIESKIIKVNIVIDKLNMLTPKFISAFKGSPIKKSKLKIVKESDFKIKLIAIDSQEVQYCHK